MMCLVATVLHSLLDVGEVKDSPDLSYGLFSEAFVLARVAYSTLGNCVLPNVD